MAAGDSLITRRLVSALGGRRALRSRPQTLDALRLRLRQGLPYVALAALTAAYDIDLRSLALVLRIPPRTLARRRQERRLRPDESDRLFRVARIAALAEASLGGREKAAVTSSAPFSTFSGRRRTGGRGRRRCDETPDARD